MDRRLQSKLINLIRLICGLRTLETRTLRGDQISITEILNGYEHIVRYICFSVKKDRTSGSFGSRVNYFGGNLVQYLAKMKAILGLCLCMS